MKLGIWDFEWGVKKCPIIRFSNKIFLQGIPKFGLQGVPKFFQMNIQLLIRFYLWGYISSNLSNSYTFNNLYFMFWRYYSWNISYFSKSCWKDKTIPSNNWLDLLKYYKTHHKIILGTPCRSNFGTPCRKFLFENLMIGHFLTPHTKSQISSFSSSWDKGGLNFQTIDWTSPYIMNVY